ncbi:hypothetical protein PC9H_009050 [Pleurotus ostreatus]|uniref:Uncharacterized protein n=1 Tax=Pleurotus ostreatus TaxID=5322 RepID=A0A8H6ZTS7_PLEOS|nr:uncharacterized protein PC9H_009050 [Pleurotus ostreatus]KAF7426681.1 hypothetical protein PC9H_009050 [Pleurotus ostreatus]
MSYSKLASNDGLTVFDDRVNIEHGDYLQEQLLGLGEQHRRSRDEYCISRWCTRIINSPIVLWCIVLLQFVTIGVLVWRTDLPEENSLFSPANEAISYKYHRFFNGFGRNVSPFQVPSSKELDDLWEDLYNLGISRIPTSQAKRLPNATEAIPGDEDNYIVELDVFHELHCLVNHYPDMRLSLPGNQAHMSHYLDSIRQSLMCSADVSLIVWKWDDEAGQSFPRGDVVHRCRDFDKIKEWAAERQLMGNFNASVHVVNDLPSPPLLY